MKMMFSSIGNLFIIMTLSVVYSNAGKTTTARPKAINLGLTKGGTVNAPAPSTGSDFLTNEFLQLQQGIEDVQTMKNKVQTRLQKMINSMFLIPKVYNGRRYYLSRKGVNTQIHTADALCAVLGGYLAEVNDMKAFNFLKKFLEENSPDALSVYIGGNDEAGGKYFMYERSGKRVSFAHWGPNEPNNLDGNENCMALYKYFHWAIADQPCYDLVRQRRFFCEVPLL